MMNRSIKPILLSTERLIIRTYLTVDAPQLHTFVLENQDLLLDTGPLTLRSNQSKADSEAFIRARNRDRQRGRWAWNAVFRKEDLAFVGQIVVTRLDGWPKRGEIGYFMARQYHGKGYATESVQSVVQYCFSELEMHKVFLRIKPDNQASLRVARKLGFDRLFLRENDFQNYHGEWLNSVYWSRKAPNSWLAWLVRAQG